MFVPIKNWKAVLIELLNIAGTGPIFGALMGACFGPVVFIWIVIILIYFLLATMLPIDKIIGKAYPVFGVSLILTVPMLVVAAILTQIDFNILWRYFSWSNQTLATQSEISKNEKIRREYRYDE